MFDALLPLAAREPREREKAGDLIAICGSAQDEQLEK